MDRIRPSPSRCLALLCFLPDTGHVTQLLQLGHLIEQTSGARVVCFLPGKFGGLVERFGFEFFPLPGLEPGPAAEIVGRLSQQSIFRNAFSDDEALRDFYWAPLHAAASREVAALGVQLLRLRPDVILADNHVFAAAYRQIARACGARLVLNRGTGTLVSRRRSFVRAYGFTMMPEAIQRAIEVIGFLSMRLRGRWRRLYHADRVRRTEVCEAQLRRRIAETFADMQVIAPMPILTTSCGLCALEAELLPGPASRSRPDEVLLAPMTADPEPLPDDLRHWLASQPGGRIVYVAFGTMVRPTRRLLRTLLSGLTAAEVSVLWALPAAQRAGLDVSTLPNRFRFEDYLPQAALLQSGLIRCFVTHAGNSSVQEALAGGVPMLCLPFLWDQPYSASLVARMGAGLRASRRWLTACGVTRDVRYLLDDPAYIGRACGIGRRLRELSSAPSQTDWIAPLFGGTD